MQTRLPDSATRGWPRFLAVLALGWGAGGCLPSPGPFVLDAVEGVVIDADSGAPLAGAEVIEWYRGAGTSDVAPHYYARWATTDASGRFVLPRALSPSPRMWLLRTYGPSYSFYHPAYGLEHAGERPPTGRMVMRGSKQVAAQRLANLDPICRGERDDPGARHLAAIACDRSVGRRPR